MKSRDLIKLINRLDPEGDNEVLINNLDIDYIQPSEPMYWDHKGYVIEHRGVCNEPTSIILRTSGRKINISVIDPFEYFEQKILQEQKFTDIQTENSYFFWESPKIYFNKLFSSFYCIEYLKTSDKDLYPYKQTLTTKITNYISNLTKSFFTEYLNYCDKLTQETYEEINLIKSLISKIYSINPNIVFNLPKKQINNTILLNTNTIKGFFFTLNNNIVNYEAVDIYDTTASNNTYPNINIDTFDFESLLSDPWGKLFNQKIENKLLKI